MSYFYENNKRSSSLMFLKIGVVKSLDNKKDKNRKDRILVSFLSEESECYASMLYNYFGEKFGSVWYPDPGTIVVVAFVENCVDGAVILGCLNKYQENLLPIDKENNKEFFKHKNGVSVEFANKEGESKITIATPKKEEIVIDLENQNLQINNEAKNVSFNFNFKEAKAEIKLKEMTINFEENLNIKSKGISIELNDKLSIKSSGIEMNSTGNIKIESSAGTDIKSSGMVNIN